MTYRVVGAVRLGTLSGRKRNWQFLLAEPGSGFFIGHFKQKEHAMTVKTPFATLLFLMMCGTSGASAQPLTEPRDPIQQRLKTGDRVSVHTTDGNHRSGRFVDSRPGGLVVDVDDRQTTFAWTEIEQVRRRSNGVLLGAVIGTAAGVVAGIPVYQIANNETGDGGKDLAVMIALGLGIGVGIDALLDRESTVYRRRAVTSSLQIRPEHGGGAVHLRLTW